MLKPALLYQEQLQQKYIETWYDDRYKYYHTNGWHERINIDDNDWNRHQFVSINKDNQVIGYISYRVDRTNNSCNGFGAINFTNDSITFGKDLATVLQNIFIKFNFHKLNFCVIIGNPIEKQYDKLIKKYNGRIVGYYKDDSKLHDGQYYDRKLYEIMRKDFLEVLNDKRKNNNPTL